MAPPAVSPLQVFHSRSLLAAASSEAAQGVPGPPYCLPGIPVGSEKSECRGGCARKGTVMRPSRPLRVREGCNPTYAQSEKEEVA